MTSGELVARRMRQRVRRAEWSNMRARILGIRLGPAGLGELAIRARAAMLATLAALVRPVPTRVVVQAALARPGTGTQSPTRAPARPLTAAHSAAIVSAGAARAPGQAMPGRVPNLT